MTVIEEDTLCDSVAVIDALVSGVVANARQISEVPLCTLVLTTSTHVSPPPEMPVTAVFAPPAQSDAMKASSSSLPDAVDTPGTVTVLLADAASEERLASTAIVAGGGVAPKLAPPIVTGVPTAPDAGERLMMPGPVLTVKLTPLLARPPTVTTTLLAP
jgi:hypothetical protein